MSLIRQSGSTKTEPGVFEDAGFVMQVVWRTAVIAVAMIALILGYRMSMTLDRLQAQLDTEAANAAERVDRSMDLSSVYTGEHQAVFLSNNQVYFCKVQTLPGEHILCEDAFYLKVQEQTDKDAEQQLNLTRLGQSELHQPEAALKIPLASVLFVEDIRSDAEILKAIAGFDRGETAAADSPR